MDDASDRELIKALQSQVQALQQQVHALMGHPEVRSSPSPEWGVSPDPVSRRRLLRGAGIAAAGAVAGASMLKATPAAADTGGDVVLGANNTAANNTQITSSDTVAFTGYSSSTDQDASAIYGLGTTGVLGVSSKYETNVSGLTVDASGVQG